MYYLYNENKEPDQLPCSGSVTLISHITVANRRHNRNGF